MLDKCRICWGVCVVVGGWVCKPNLVISDELIKKLYFFVVLANYYHHQGWINRYIATPKSKSEA